MHNQATLQGRYLGGRPPYGYRLVDAGPHPNPTDARWGRRLQRLAPDPRTAPHLSWMFQQRLAGHSVASIARHLNERGVPCPSSADPDRNRHRTRGAWILRTVAVILANPRYTGRQSWTRRATGTSGPASTPTLSAYVAHPTLLMEQDFVAAQQIRAARPAGDGRTRLFDRPTNAPTTNGRRRSTSAKTISSTRSASGSDMNALTATLKQSLTDHDRDGWQQSCANQGRSSFTTAPGGV
ncbi:recombinase family protein [Amycolatopsis sp. NPDC005961]|uniref:recombinase family protein n=1 Tax=Amycolatopsis sp. NPDC005961 TaxID=3156720 RepID=UPI00340455AF